MSLDWIGWGGLNCEEQLTAVAVSSFALGGWFVLTVSAVLGGLRLRRKKARKRGRR